MPPIHVTEHELARWRREGLIVGEQTCGPVGVTDVETGRHRSGLPIPWPAVVPMPPSVNSMYRNAGKKGRVKSASYKYWLDKAVPMLKRWARPLAYPVAVQIVIHEKMSARSDVDNRAKAILDACVTAGILRDDGRKYVRKVSIEYVGDSAGVAVTVIEN